MQLSKKMVTETSRIQRWHTEDIDEQSGLLPGWEQEYRQLSCGKFTGSISTAHGPHVTVVGEQTNQSLHESVVPPAGHLVFALVLNDDEALRVNRRPVTTTSLLVLEGGKEYDLRTSGSTELLGIAFERDWLFERHDRQHAASVEDVLKRCVVPLDRMGTSILRNFWLILSHILQREVDWPASMPLTLVADTALNNLLLALNMSGPPPVAPSPGPSARDGTVTQQAIRFMRTHLDRLGSIEDVCAAIHVSRRTLHNHFEKCLHMSPQQYLKILRLNVARSLLRDTATRRNHVGRHPTIAEIAAQCGYDHASRFAGDYKRQFGMLPSETVRETARLATLRS